MMPQRLMVLLGLVGICSSSGAGSLNLTVATLQMDRYTVSSNVTAAFLAIRSHVAAAKAAGADLVVLPEQWLPRAEPAAAAAGYRALAAEAGVALAGTWGDGIGGSHAELFDRAGASVLQYSKRQAGNAPGVSAGSPGDVGILGLGNGLEIRVGVLLGSDVLFMEPTRAIGLQAADLAVHHAGGGDIDGGSGGSGGYDPRSLYWAAGDNKIPVATAADATSGGSGLVTERCYFASDGGTHPGHSGPGTNYPDGLCNLTGPGERTVLHSVNVAARRQRWRAAGGWDMPRDGSRRPFDYQPLCYPAARNRVTERAALLHSHHHPHPAAAAVGTRGEAGAEAAGLKVTVALLQMSAVRSPKGVNPVPAQAAKAEASIRRAAAAGADVAVMPELWSIGFNANSDVYADRYSDSNSTGFAFGAVLTWAETRAGPFVTKFRHLAAELGIAIAATFLEQVVHPEGDVLPPRNSVAMIDRHGEIVYTYAKVHPAWSGADGTDPEGLTMAGRTFYSGNLDLGPGRGNVTVCSNICFDREHPESARLCMLAGAELVLLPTACTVDWTYVDKVAVRAMSNVMAVAMANYANSSSAPTSWANGHSMAAGADGELIMVAPGDPANRASEPGKEGVYLAELDIAAVRRLRSTARGSALMAGGKLEPRLCRLPVAAPFGKPECNEHRLWL